MKRNGNAQCGFFRMAQLNMAPSLMIFVKPSSSQSSDHQQSGNSGQLWHTTSLNADQDALFVFDSCGEIEIAFLKQRFKITLNSIARHFARFLKVVSFRH